VSQTSIAMEHLANVHLDGNALMAFADRFVATLYSVLQDGSVLKMKTATAIAILPVIIRNALLDTNVSTACASSQSSVLMTTQTQNVLLDGYVLRDAAALIALQVSLLADLE